jgi:hypothetical protein
VLQNIVYILLLESMRMRTLHLVCILKLNYYICVVYAWELY